MPEQVTVGQVAQQAIGRLQGRIETLTAIMGDVSRISADLQDQLRQLVSYCEGQAADADDSMGYYERQYARPVYGEIAEKLRAILDGEQ